MLLSMTEVKTEELTLFSIFRFKEIPVDGCLSFRLVLQIAIRSTLLGNNLGTQISPGGTKEVILWQKKESSSSLKCPHPVIMEA